MWQAKQEQMLCRSYKEIEAPQTLLLWPRQVIHDVEVLIFVMLYYARSFHLWWHSRSQCSCHVDLERHQWLARKVHSLHGEKRLSPQFVFNFCFAVDGLIVDGSLLDFLLEPTSECFHMQISRLCLSIKLFGAFEQLWLQTSLQRAMAVSKAIFERRLCACHAARYRGSQRRCLSSSNFVDVQLRFEAQLGHGQ